MKREKGVEWMREHKLARIVAAQESLLVIIIV